MPHVRLGEGFRPRAPLSPSELAPPEPDPHLVLLGEILSALAGLRAELVTIAVPPQVEIPPVDLGEIVTAVQGLKPSVTADEIGEAIAEKLLPNREPPEMGEVLTSIVEALDRLDFRMKAIGTQAYGGGAVTLSERTIDQLADGIQVNVTGGDASADLQRDIKRAVTDFEARFDKDGGSNVIYIGKALNGTATSAAGWTIQKIDYDASDDPTRIQVLSGVVWDDRTTLAGWS